MPFFESITELLNPFDRCDNSRQRPISRYNRSYETLMALGGLLILKTISLRPWRLEW